MSPAELAAEEELPVRAEIYAPSYEVAVAGQVLASVTTGDILDIQVTRELKNASGASLTVNDWDDSHVTFKYSSSDTFEIGKFLTIRLGYSQLPSQPSSGGQRGGAGASTGSDASPNALVQVFSGYITSLSPRFPDAAPPTLTIAGQDALRRTLSNRRPTGHERRLWLGLTNAEIVRDIATRLDLEPKVEDTAVPYKRVAIKNQDYATFLIERAALSDFDVYIEPTARRTARSPDKALFFGPRRDGRKASARRVMSLAWGTNLISFTPRLSAAHQVKSVTVRGWDPFQKKPIEVKVDRSALRGPSSRTTGGPATADDASAEVVIDRPVNSEHEALEVAKALLQERANMFIVGTGKTIGQPDLLPGDTVRMTDLGKRFSIDYLVTKVVHSLGAAGFTTEFEVSGAGQGDVERGSGR